MANAIRRHVPSRGLYNSMLTSVLLEDVSKFLFYQGHEFNRSLYKAFYDLHIEDMWLPFFCNTANITTSRMEVHETGYAWRFIRKPRELTLVIFTNSLLQALRCLLSVLFLHSVTMETCSWTEGTVRSSL
jgi:hypothetical protein